MNMKKKPKGIRTGPKVATKKTMGLGELMNIGKRPVQMPVWIPVAAVVSVIAAAMFLVRRKKMVQASAPAPAKVGDLGEAKDLCVQEKERWRKDYVQGYLQTKLLKVMAGTTGHVVGVAIRNLTDDVIGGTVMLTMFFNQGGSWKKKDYPRKPINLTPKQDLTLQLPIDEIAANMAGKLQMAAVVHRAIPPNAPVDAIPAVIGFDCAKA
jgi:hypothetical protein